MKASTLVFRSALGWALIACALMVGTARGGVTVVNMIPNSLSGESNADSEANLAVNPSNPNQLAGSAFTPDPFGGPNAPIYISTDGGKTWSLNSIVPSEVLTADITLKFSGSNRLYAGIIPQPILSADEIRLNILRAEDFTGGDLMELLEDRRGVDQPFVTALTIDGKDHVYVGNNSTGSAPRTATVDLSLNAAGDPSHFRPTKIETRAPQGQDGPPIRTAVSPDGKVIYGVFYHWTNFDEINNLVTVDVVIVRDDNSGQGTPPFGALKDADGRPGLRLIKDTIIQFDTGGVGSLGQDRVGGDLAVAVDPRDSRTVYVAFSNQIHGVNTLHLRRSTNSGATWSNDLRTLANAKNPGLAINSDGKVGFVYQQVVRRSSRKHWVTHFERSTDAFANVEDLVLSDTPADTPLANGNLPYLGDYLQLLSLDQDFYGVFTANNTPDRGNFPSGVSFQRNADFDNKQLLDIDGSTPVAISIDPFFFKVTEAATEARVSGR